jgi:hypothetical protein
MSASIAWMPGPTFCAKWRLDHPRTANWATTANIFSSTDGMALIAHC